MISFDGLQLWDRFRNKRGKQIADYLDELATEATELAEIWQKVVEDLESNNAISIDNQKVLNRLLEIPPEHRMSNARVYNRLERFRRDLSQVLSGSSSEYTEPLLLSVSSLLISRNNLRFGVGIDSDSIEKEDLPFSSLVDTVQQMHKEAAELHALAKKYRALKT
ncbi:hypothetical protein I6Y99_004964 [Vibrio parahaemolyticus]|uniref:hypothetical protein n=1 Tax=Vibrio parahaemolyticus TaxID=670 RepID=UPI00111F32DD|nr:hypothetical protein [Vibrio parahaemolyticus]EGQ7810896.1 hypothetical protein [Vibrio parahaemolyticus]EJG1118567.1 hypothetical protein [Vibrio parahaemolyticus]MBM4982817.1 hypothetical protein [Vibrio parahaemolyticus]MCZ6298895.1 hypothetical protein [Vibrio parahaemolyticus]TOI47792.1 hypothetical protein CGI59_23735 [Vibrio parahaemolyticus]